MFTELDSLRAELAAFQAENEQCQQKLAALPAVSSNQPLIQGVIDKEAALEALRLPYCGSLFATARKATQLRRALRAEMASNKALSAIRQAQQDERKSLQSRAGSLFEDEACEGAGSLESILAYEEKARVLVVDNTKLRVAADKVSALTTQTDFLRASLVCALTERDQAIDSLSVALKLQLDPAERRQQQKLRNNAIAALRIQLRDLYLIPETKRQEEHILKAKQLREIFVTQGLCELLRRLYQFFDQALKSSDAEILRGLFERFQEKGIEQYHADVFQLLVDRIVKHDGVDALSAPFGRHKETFLHWSAYLGMVEATEILLAAGASPDVQSGYAYKNLPGDILLDRVSEKDIARIHTMILQKRSDLYLMP